MKVAKNISMSCIAGAVVLLCLASLQGQDEDWPQGVGAGAPAPQSPGVGRRRRVEPPAAQPATAADANTIGVAYAPPVYAGDANMTAAAPAFEPNWAEGVAMEVEQLDRGSENAQRQWENRTENRAEIARAVHNQQTAEMEFLKKLAESEGATRTAKAIELLMAAQEKRFNALVVKLEELQRQQRAAEREERRPRTATRSSADRPDRTARERTSRLRERADRTPADEPQQ